MPRRKETAAPAPASTADAAEMLGKFVFLERQKLLARIGAEAKIDRIKQQRDQHLAELEAEARPLFAGLKSWWEAAGKVELAKGKRSAELAGAKIGIRLTPPAVKFQRGVKVGDVLAWLGSLRWSRAREFKRTKVELDKQAIIKAALADKQIAETFAKHLTVEQVDEFFIDTGLDEDELKKELAAS